MARQRRKTRPFFIYSVFNLSEGTEAPAFG
jgi:hypothetical protein